MQLSPVFELYDLKFHVFGLLLLLPDPQVAEAIEELPGVLLVLQSQEIGEEVESVSGGIGIIDHYRFGEVVQLHAGVPGSRDFPRPLGNFQKLHRKASTSSFSFCSSSISLYSSRILVESL